MTYWNAALLGLVQGLAEFLPISSSGHLAVLQNFLAIGDMENHMLFDVLLHLGTLAAVILAFWKDVREVVTEFLRMLHLRRTPRGLKPNRRERRLISFLILATLPLIPAAFLSNVVESLTLVIDKSIERMKLNKFFTIVCDHPEPICDFITEELDHSATTYHAEGAYSHAQRTVILTVVDVKQAILLQRFIKKNEPTAFITVTKSSEIIGKGFSNYI